MKVEYETTICFKVIHEVDTLEDLKGDREYAECIAQLICDEATTYGAVASYIIIDSCLDVSEIIPVNVSEK